MTLSEWSNDEARRERSRPAVVADNYEDLKQLVIKLTKLEMLQEKLWKVSDE